ncbi:MAG: ParB N-terminal domain-containing protein [Phycisphaeraceae bacterium]|nr:ParB N-terminal domain-containing protein [Phycisphaeraceae bacterium]
MQVTLRPVDSLKPYKKNPRKNDAAVKSVARSIREYGFRQPIVVDESGVIIVGHTRWKAAKHLGLAQVPVHVAVGLSPEQARAYRLADNRTNEIAEWDGELLPVELLELNDLGFDLADLGWSPQEVDALLAPPANVGVVDPDEVPLPPDAATTQPGDLWILGSHRLLCGDSGNAADVDRLLDGAVIDLVNMDPPYNVKVEPRSNNAIAAGLSSFSAAQRKEASVGDQQAADLNRYPAKAKPTSKRLRAKDRPLANDFVTDDAFVVLLSDWFGNAARVLKSGGAFYVWGGYANVANYPPALAKAGLYFSQAIIWHKLHPVLTRKDFMGDHEWCFYGWKEGAGHHFYGPNNVPDVWPVKKVNPQSMVHLTEKPVELSARAIQYSSKPGERVLDLFGGSGSTLIACEQQGRRAYLMELDAPYCDVIVQRWKAFTGKKAERVKAVKGAKA